MIDPLTSLALGGVGLLAGFVDAVAGGASESTRLFSVDRQPEAKSTRLLSVDRKTKAESTRLVSVDRQIKAAAHA